MATLNLSSTKTSINATLSGLSTVSYPRLFEWYFDGSYDSSDFVYGNVDPPNLSNYWSGLSPGTSYSVEVIVYNDNTGAVVATFSQTISTEEESDPVVMGTCSISPTQVSVGDPERITWNYSGTPSTSSWFDIYASQSPSFSSATLVASVRPPATYKDANWSQPGTWYFWVVYRENSSRTTNYATLKVLQSAWLLLQPYIYVNFWRTAKRWMFINSDWRVTKRYVYKE